MAQTFNTSISFVQSTSRKDRRKGAGSLSVSAVAGGGVGNVADSATQAWARNNFVDKTTEQEISAPKIFLQGIKIGDIAFYEHPDGYVYLDAPLVLKGGLTMYGDDGTAVPSIFDAIPIDNLSIVRNNNKALSVNVDGRTIKLDGNGALYVDETALSISGGGGVVDSVYWNNVIGKPSWIGSTKPSYKYSEIEERPDLSVYALTSSIPTNNNQLTNGAGYITSSALNGYATQTWVEGKKYLTGITSSMITSALGFTPYNSANFTKVNIKSTLGISDWALESVKPTYKYSEISNTPDLSVYALNTDLAKKWTQNDAKIANWDSAYGWGNHANAGYAKASDVTNEFKNYVKLAGDSQSITAQHNFTNGLRIGGISLRKVDDYLYLDSSLVLSGGVTMYGDDGTTVKPIWESIPFDRSTIDWVDGKWTVVGGVGSGGISEEFLNVKLQEYQPLLSATNKLPYSLISGTPDLSVYFLKSSFTKANIKSTLGISDWALASAAPTIKKERLTNFDSATPWTAFYTSFQASNRPAGANYFSGFTLSNIDFQWADNTYLIQLALSHNGTLHTRYRSGGSFHEWKTLAFTSDIPTKLSQLTDDMVSGKYLPLTGGTINGTSYNPLSIASNDNALMQVLLYTKDTLRGRVQYNVNYGVGFQNVGIGGIYVKNDGTPIFLDSSDASKTLLHAGNYSNLLAGGAINGSLTATSFIGNLTGNADSATKLATPRTIWGQSFDGAGNIDGDITLKNYSAIKFKASSNANSLNVMMVDANNRLTIGYDLAANSLPTRIDGNSVSLRYGAGHINGLILDSTGNVAIGGTAAEAKLHVHGTAKFEGDTTFSSKVVIGTIPVYQSADGTLFVDANVVFTGGVAMYGNTTTTINEE